MGGALLRSSHAVGVVLAHVDHGEFPETSHVGSLQNLTLIGRTVTIHSHGKVLLTPVLEGECEAGSNGDLSSHNTVSTIEIALLVVEMHGATFTHAGASALAHLLSKDAVGGVTAGIGSAMVTVRGNDTVVASHACFHALRNRLLPIVQVEEASDLTLLVELIAHNLHSAHRGDLVEVMTKFVLGDSRLSGH